MKGIWKLSCEGRGKWDDIHFKHIVTHCFLTIWIWEGEKVALLGCSWEINSERCKISKQKLTNKLNLDVVAHLRAQKSLQRSICQLTHFVRLEQTKVYCVITNSWTNNAHMKYVRPMISTPNWCFCNKRKLNKLIHKIKCSPKSPTSINLINFLFGQFCVCQFQSSAQFHFSQFKR